ncbi:unnamed protein product [Orchesella dallaii]|uniref:Transmembrane protein n=1 Tax=Orchesella dallaii TaxID=48710 RepID=A0ABP1REN9_9HEXA
MAPASKSTGTSSTKRPPKPQEVQNSPSSKSHTSSKTGGSGNRGHRSRRASAIKSSLHETLSSFGDDVIKVKNYASTHAYDNHGYFQPDLPLDTNNFDGGGGGDFPGVGSTTFNSSPLEKGAVESELAIIMSHDPNFQTKNFEKVDPSEVGVRSSKWQKLIQTSISSSRFQKLKKQDRQLREEDNEFLSNLEEYYNDKGRIEFNPPFWGVSYPTRNKISFLSVSLILHELACFTSCVLLGCMAFQGMEAVSWAQQKPFTENWLYFKCYSSFQTILVVISCLGFLNRVDTTELRSLWLLPLFLIPVLGLSVSDYCNKAWELQRLECLNFFRLDPASQKKVHLSQDCPPVLNVMKNGNNPFDVPSPNNAANKIMSSALTAITEMDARGTAPMVMRILAALSILVISLYLFCCRKSYFLIDLFGPPKELTGNIELVTRKKSESLCDGRSDNDYQEDVKVIFKRNA